MCIRKRGNWKKLIFLAFFPVASKIETTLPQGVKTIGGRGSVQKKKKFYIIGPLPVLQMFPWFSRREEGRVSDFLFLGFQQNHPYEGVAGFTCNNKLPTIYMYSNEISESKPSSFKSSLPTYEKSKKVLIMLLHVDFHSPGYFKWPLI